MYTLKFYHSKTHLNNGYFIESTTSCDTSDYIRTDRSADLSQVIRSFIHSNCLTTHTSKTCLAIRIDNKYDDHIETICKFDNVEQLVEQHPELFI